MCVLCWGSRVKRENERARKPERRASRMRAERGWEKRQIAVENLFCLRREIFLLSFFSLYAACMSFTVYTIKKKRLF